VYFSGGWFCSMIVPKIDVTARTIRVTMASLTEVKKFQTRSIGGCSAYLSHSGHLQLFE